MTVERADGDHSGETDDFSGMLNDPSGSALVRGLCGDEMAFSIVVDGGTIVDVRYWTDGCDSTRLCGEAVARRSSGLAVMDALSISAGEIIESEVSLEGGERHCAILAVTALYRAIADYLLKP